MNRMRNHMRCNDSGERMAGEKKEKLFKIKPRGGGGKNKRQSFLNTAGAQTNRVSYVYA
jgi:hypothetical protein